MNITQDEIIVANTHALKLIKDTSFHQAEILLISLQDTFPVTTTPSSLETIVLGNLSYLYCKIGSGYRSISLLSRASLHLSPTSSDLTILVGVQINMCAMNSSLGFHKSALQNALQALELSDKIQSFEIKALVNYNLGCQLGLMEKLEKAMKYFREAHFIAMNNCGAGHKLAILAAKAEDSYRSYQYRINSSSINSKNSSFSTNSNNTTKYTALSSGAMENRIKINFSAKIASISHFGTGSLSRQMKVGMPYIKEFRTSKRISGSIYVTPKTAKKKIVSGGRVHTASNSFEGSMDQGLKIRLKAIRGHITFLENKLKDFINNSIKVMNLAEDQDEPEKVKATVCIQKWYRNLLRQKRRLYNSKKPND